MQTVKDMYKDGPEQKGFGFVDKELIAEYSATVPQDTNNPEDILLVRWADYRNVPVIKQVKTKPFEPFLLKRSLVPVYQFRNRLRIICTAQVVDSVKLDAPTKGKKKSGTDKETGSEGRPEVQVGTETDTSSTGE